MKKYRFVFVFLLLFSVFFTSCSNFHIANWIPGEHDFYSGKRPTDFPLSKWVSESPNIWFEVPEIEENTSLPDSLYGKAETAEEAVDIQVVFDRGVTMWVYKLDPNNQFVLLLEGTCYFEEEKVVVTIKKESDILFNGKYEELVFVKKNDNS